MFGPLVHLGAREFRSHAKGNNAGHAFRAGSLFTFLVSADILTDQANATPYVKRATPLG